MQILIAANCLWYINYYFISHTSDGTRRHRRFGFRVSLKGWVGESRDEEKKRLKYTKRTKRILFSAVMKCHLSRHVSNHLQTITTRKHYVLHALARVHFPCARPLLVITLRTRRLLRRPGDAGSDYGRISSDGKRVRREERRQRGWAHLGGGPSLYPPRPDKRGRRRK